MPARKVRPLPPHVAALAHAAPFVDCTYFVCDPVTGHIKIGTTWMPRLAERMLELERSLHRRLTLLAITLGGRKVERAYHDRLATTRIYSEWFRPSSELTECLDGIRYWGEWAVLLAAEQAAPAEAVR